MLKKISIMLALIVAIPIMAYAQGDNWRSELKAIDVLLRNRKYDVARLRSERLMARMLEGLGRGSSASYTLSVASAFRAIAEAGLGKKDDAIWYWRTAQSIFPDIEKTDLSPYGAPAEFLRSCPFRMRPGKEEPRTPTSDILPPEVIKKPLPQYPPGLKVLGVETTFAVEVIVEADGSISEPLLLKPILEPAMIYAVYEAMQRWRFKPATLNGRSIPVYWTLTVNFEIRQ